MRSVVASHGPGSNPRACSGATRCATIGEGGGDSRRSTRNSLRGPCDAAPPSRCHDRATSARPTSNSRPPKSAIARPPCSCRAASARREIVYRVRDVVVAAAQGGGPATRFPIFVFDLKIKMLDTIQAIHIDQIRKTLALIPLLVIRIRPPYCLPLLLSDDFRRFRPLFNTCEVALDYSREAPPFYTSFGGCCGLEQKHEVAGLARAFRSSVFNHISRDSFVYCSPLILSDNSRRFRPLFDTCEEALDSSREALPFYTYFGGCCGLEQKHEVAGLARAFRSSGNSGFTAGRGVNPAGGAPGGG
ncbi:hypothetical protein F511_12909 [Dorcoceras hygrometricum]|uniref:Uncharacterized protein n=1 Tax=Dorcoceras hygrometricum TaxID=472368 RepID=A0A2Z7CEH4_9LAMI|nr:hypothetical protein F511_12909 [Dorcoceras hygrometricum]